MEPHETKAPNGQREDDGAQTFGERIDRVNETAQQAWTRTRDSLGDLTETLDIKGRVKRHPYGTVAAAIGIGYLLGGGLFSKLTARLLGTGLRLGLRLAAIPLIKDELYAFVETLGEDDGEGGSQGRRRTKATNDQKKGRQP